jgi:predicted phosphate transport protein (TIGR00153 family)
MVKFSLTPREEKFFDLFEQGAANMVRAAHKLKELVDKWENPEAVVAEITEIEHQGDSITHQIIAQLHRTFITPFDREDISLIASSLDDVTDFIQAAADAMLVYKIGKPGEKAKELTAIIVQAAEEVQRAMLQLKHRREFKQMLVRCVEINRLENMADRIYRAALGDLFDGKTNIVDVIKWREIYEHMESATDRCEDVADVLEGIALKHG